MGKKGYQTQRKTRQHNEDKILQALRDYGNMSFSQLLDETGLSRPVLSDHLKRLTAEGRIGKGLYDANIQKERRPYVKHRRARKGTYWLASPQLRRAKWFATHWMGRICNTPFYEIVDVNELTFERVMEADWYFDDDERVAEKIVETLENLFFFIFRRLVEAYQNGDTEEIKSIIETVLPALPMNIDVLILSYTGGGRIVVDKEPPSTGYHYGQGLPADIPMEEQLRVHRKLSKRRYEILFQMIDEKLDENRLKEFNRLYSQQPEPEE